MRRVRDNLRKDCEVKSEEKKILELQWYLLGERLKQAAWHGTKEDFGLAVAAREAVADLLGRLDK